MKRTVRLGTTIAAAAAVCSLATACGGDSAGAATDAPAPTTAATPAAPTPTPTPSSSADGVNAFITSVRAKVESGDYEPTKGSSKKAQAGTKKYLAALTDERLGALGGYNCQVKKETSAAGAKFSRADFEKLMLKNSGTEEGIKPLLGLTWDEATTIICPD